MSSCVSLWNILTADVFFWIILTASGLLYIYMKKYPQHVVLVLSSIIPMFDRCCKLLIQPRLDLSKPFLLKKQHIGWIPSFCWSNHHVGQVTMFALKSQFSVGFFSWQWRQLPISMGLRTKRWHATGAPASKKALPGRFDPLVVPLGYPLGLLLLVSYYLKQHH